MEHAYANYFSKPDIICYRKMQKKKTKPKKKKHKKFTVSFPGETPLKLKKSPNKIKQFPCRTCCKHSRLLHYYNWHVIVATVYTLIRMLLVCSVCPDDLSENLVLLVDVLTWIALMYFIMNNSFILLQQMKTELWCIELP